MKTILTAALLLSVNLLAFSQQNNQTTPGEEIQAGYSRQYIKLRDKQVSPMMYVSNLNGFGINYSRMTTNNQWLAAIYAGVGELVAPSLGIRQFKFSEDQTQPLLLVPTLYRANVSLTYHRLLKQKGIRSTWAGIQIQETINYADGLAMTTWVMNTLSLSLTQQTSLRLNEHNQILVDASLPILAAVSRLPYSNVVSVPEMSNARAFLKETSWESLNKYFNPQFTLAYRIHINKRFGFQASYTYQWLHYPEPNLIRSASHTGNLSFIYHYHFQFN